MLLFDTTMLISCGVTVVVAVTDKILESYGFYFLRDILRFTVALGGLLLGVYFIENNPLLRWLR